VVVSIFTAAVVAGCGNDQPALTLVFESVPPGTDHLDVTLHAMGATFMGPDAGNDNVSVSYEDGNVLIGINGAYAKARLNRIRLPLTAAEMITLEGSARAMGDNPAQTAAPPTSVAAGQSVTMIFDFGRDAGVESAPGDAGDGGPATDGAPDAPLSDAAPDGGTPDVAGMDVGTLDVGTDAPGDAPVETHTDAPMDVTGDVATDMAPSDATTDSPRDTPADLPVEVPPVDAGTDAAIATTCVVAAPYPASVIPGGSGPSVAYAGGLFGVAWQTTNGLSYNAVSPAGTLQFAQDKMIVAAATGLTLAPPHLAAIGSDFVLAFGRRDASGAQAAVMRFPAATGVAGPTASGMNRLGMSSPPDVGGLAVSSDGRQIAVISRPADLSAQTAATVDGFDATPALLASHMPAQLGATRTTGIGSVPGRFMAAAVLDATSAGGTLVELLDTNLTVDSWHPFTGSGNSPVVGSGAATMSVAGAGDRVAVAWIDLQSARREAWIAVYSVSSNTLVASSQASVSSATPKYYPHVVFDGAAFAMAWLEGTSTNDAQIKLRRYETNLTAVASTLTVAQAGTVGLGDFGLTDGGANVYGVAAALAGSTQGLFTITCH
jgi:hypothetical protein